MLKGKKTVALCTSRIYDRQVHDFIKRINEGISDTGCSLMIFTLSDDVYWEEDKLRADTAVFDIIPYEITDAVIIMDEKIKSSTVSRKIIEKAHAHDIPVLIVDGQYDGCFGVKFDYKKGFENVVRSTFESRKISHPHIMAGFPDNIFSMERIDAFKKVITDYGFSFDESMVSYGDFWANPTIRESLKLIGSGNIPDAIFCANDIMALNVCSVFQQHGYRIPEDLIVTGFDGFDEVFMVTPAITTAMCTTPELAGAAIDFIRNVANGDISKEDIKLSVVLPTYVPNESTGFPKVSMGENTLQDHFNSGFYRHQESAHMMFQIITDMQTSKDPNEMVAYLNDRILHDQELIKNVLLIINKNCFRTDEYYFDSSKSRLDPHELVMYIDSDNERVIKIIPDGHVFFDEGNPVLGKVMESGYPLIFYSLAYMDIPMGYACFNYRDYDNVKYSRSSIISSTIEMGLGGYINMNYQRSLVRKVNEMYERDYLTGLYNRVAFYNIFEEVCREKRGTNTPVSVIMSDLDDLKMINDNYGHKEGDRAIKVIADAVKKSCPCNAVNVRFGGDEIFSVIPGDCDVDSIIGKIERYLTDCNASSEKAYDVIASCGAYTTCFDDSFSIKSALEKADAEMYRIKKEHHRGRQK
ncbi:MAG: GGDEF domain-containing protein [Lachnospiraceae bacterium]|nr:GGDEF domain-containing protein [Lachnospiraceae bacterium]